MPLKFRPAGLGSGIDKNPQDSAVYSGGWDIGRIYETRSGPGASALVPVFAVQGPMTRSIASRPLRKLAILTGHSKEGLHD
jgi:hypothetical protein